MKNFCFVILFLLSVSAAASGLGTPVNRGSAPDFPLARYLTGVSEPLTVADSSDDDDANPPTRQPSGIFVDAERQYLDLRERGLIDPALRTPLFPDLMDFIWRDLRNFITAERTRMGAQQPAMRAEDVTDRLIQALVRFVDMNVVHVIVYNHTSRETISELGAGYQPTVELTLGVDGINRVSVSH